MSLITDLRIQPLRFTQCSFCFTGFPGRLQRLCQIELRNPVLGVGHRGRPKIADSQLQIPLSSPNFAEVIVSVSAGRLNAQRLLKPRDRLSPMFPFSEDTTQVVVRIDEERVPLQSLQEMFLSGSQLALALENQPEVIVRFSMRPVYLQHQAVVRRRLIQLAQKLASTAQVVARQNQARIHREGSTESLLRSFQIAALQLGE